MKSSINSFATKFFGKISFSFVMANKNAIYSLTYKCNIFQKETRMKYNKILTYLPRNGGGILLLLLIYVLYIFHLT